MGRPDEEDVFPLGIDDDEDAALDDDDEWDDDEVYAPGPDARDRDLMDGTWEERYYTGRERQFDWTNVLIALALLALVALVVPGLLVAFG
jgi:hypothetical protein